MNGATKGVGTASREKDLRRIREALTAASDFFRSVNPSTMAFGFKRPGDPVTAADLEVNQRLLELLPREGEGWLSEETAENLDRLKKKRVWVVDPLDGTREFVASIPEWCVSVGLVENGRAVAGGICNPATGEMFIGSVETGLTVVGNHTPHWENSGKPLVLASRSETNRGEWDWVRTAPFTVRPVGSVAYKLALVAAGLADATWTLVPKHEWDVAAGVALVLASGGVVRSLQGEAPIFNRRQPRLDGLLAYSTSGHQRFAGLIEEWLSPQNAAGRKPV